MSRTVDLTQALSDEDKEYLLARGREQDVVRNEAEFGDDPDAVRAANYIPGTSIDEARGVPPTPGGDPKVVNGGGVVHGDVEFDEEGDARSVVGPLDGETEDNYESWDKGALKAEIASRNEDLPDDEQMSVSGNKGELIARLRQHDAEVEDDEE